MKLLRWVISIVLILISVPVSLYFLFILSKPAQAMHRLDKDEIFRLRAANDYVQQYQQQYKLLPTPSDFEVWAKQAPEELRLDGVGFEYGRSRDSANQNYYFSYWVATHFFIGARKQIISSK